MRLPINSILDSPARVSADIRRSELQKNSSQNIFSEKLKSAIDSINNAEIAADKKTEALTSGNINDLHDVMVTAQKASLTVETAVQIQQKAIDAYNEMMRMQI